MLLLQEDVEWCESNTTAAWAEDVLGVLSTVRAPWYLRSLGAGCKKQPTLVARMFDGRVDRLAAAGLVALP